MTRNKHLSVDKDYLNFTRDDGSTPLHRTSSNLKSRLVNHLWMSILEADAKINAPRNDCSTPLYWESLSGSAEVVHKMLTTCAEIHAATNGVQKQMLQVMTFARHFIFHPSLWTQELWPHYWRLALMLIQLDMMVGSHYWCFSMKDAWYCEAFLWSHMQI